MLHVASDLHLDFYPDCGVGFCESLAGDPEGTLVLAGDIMETRHEQKFLAVVRILTGKFKNVVMVSGNHEYWGSNPADTHELLDWARREFPNLHILQNEYKSIDGQYFYGGTLWYPKAETERFADFYQILDHSPWVYEDNREFKERLFSEGWGPMDKKELIVISHHLPSVHSIHPLFKGAYNNHFFCDDMTDEIIRREFKMFIFGHTHFPFDYMLGKTRMYCNPKAYPREEENNPNFLERMRVEI